MRGRPGKQHRPELNARLHAACLTRGLNGASIADVTGLSPATISRILKTGSYSSVSEARIQAYLDSLGGSVPISPTNSLDEPNRIRLALHLLQEIVRIAPDLQYGLEAALNHAAAAARTAKGLGGDGEYTTADRHDPQSRGRG